MAGSVNKVIIIQKTETQSILGAWTKCQVFGKDKGCCRTAKCIHRLEMERDGGVPQNLAERNYTLTLVFK